MVVVVHVRLADDIRHEADVLDLGVDVQRAVHDQLDVVRNAVRNVDIGILRLLVDERLVAQRPEVPPDVAQVLGRVQDGICLDIEVAGVIPAADGQPGNVLEGLVLGVGHIGRGVAVMQADVGRGLQGVVHVGAAVPDPVGLVHLHVVHVDDQGNVHGRMPLIGINVLVNREGVRLYTLIVNAVEARLADVGKVDLDIVVAMVIFAPDIDIHRLGDRLGAVRVDAEDAGRGRGGVIAVELGHRDLLLRGGIAHLRETDVGRTDPVLGHARLQEPLQHHAGLAARQQRTEHERAVLGEVTAVVDADLRLGADTHAERLVLRRHHDLMARGHGLRHEEIAAAAVVEGAFTEILRNLLRHRMDLRVVHRILGKDAREAVHQVVLAEVRRREELQVQAGLAHEGFRNGLVQEYLHHASVVLRAQPDTGHEVIVRMGKRHFHEIAFAVHDAVRHRAENVPLFRGVHQSDTTAGGDPFAALDDLQAGEFLVIKTSVVDVVIHEDVRSPGLEITEVVHGQDGGVLGATRRRKQGCKSDRAEGQ